MSAIKLSAVKCHPGRFNLVNFCNSAIGGCSGEPLADGSPIPNSYTTPRNPRSMGSMEADGNAGSHNPVSTHKFHYSNDAPWTILMKSPVKSKPKIVVNPTYSILLGLTYLLTSFLPSLLTYLLYLSFYLSIYPCIYLSIYLSIYLFPPGSQVLDAAAYSKMNSCSSDPDPKSPQRLNLYVLRTQ